MDDTASWLQKSEKLLEKNLNCFKENVQRLLRVTWTHIPPSETHKHG